MRYGCSLARRMLWACGSAGFIVGALILLLWGTLPASASPAATITISVDTTTDSNATAYQACTGVANDCSLRGAISKANADAANEYIINLPAGTYQLTIPGRAEDGNATGDLDLINGSTITIKGAGADVTFIQAGASTATGIDGVLDVLTGTLTLQDVTIRYGNNLDSGGGILNEDAGTTVIQTSVVINNMASKDGGGIENWGSLTLINNQVLSNTVTNGVGGGIDNYNGTVTVTLSTISYNDASAGIGGGIYNGGDSSAGVITISNTLISGNQALQGGGIGNDLGDVGSEVHIYRSALVNNTATSGSGGGIASFNTGLLYVTNSTFSGNSASSTGGAIYAEDNSVIANSTFFGNSAPVGGGIEGAGLATVLRNSILTQQTGGDCAATISGSNNLIDDLTCGAAPSFRVGAVTNFDATLRDNGGNTPTHALLPGSNAIDAGSGGCPDAGGTPLTMDQRGSTRPVDYDRDSTATCDIGAFELQAAEVMTATLTAGQQRTFGATLARITLSTGDAGTVTVTRYNSPPGGGSPDSGEMPFYWTINATGTTYDLDLMLCYTDWEVSQGNGISEAALTAFRSTGSTWSSAGGTVDTVNNCVTLSNVTALSDWTLGNSTPTVVTLRSLTARSVSVVPAKWVVVWVLAALSVLAVFHLWGMMGIHKV